MSLRLYDTATRSTRPFEPLEPGQASIYLCGLTVQGPPHIGHLRSAVAFDILARWLRTRRYAVTFVRNVTDIDDKIVAKSAAAGVPWWAWAYENERATAEAYALLGCEPVTYEPRATGHIPEMVELMRRLIDGGHAYAARGDVYFDVQSYPHYGALSGQRIDEMQPSADSIGDNRKRDPRDFALWKAAKPGEPYWPTPWGIGRPGWHLECSAMAAKYLGPTFDIHGGGLDLVFPHHENEVAQSQAAGDGFARYWMHNGLVTLGGAKMSKSLDNFLTVAETVRQWRPVDLRYYLGAAHYRSSVEFTPTSLDEAARAFRGIESFVQHANEVADVVEPAELPAAFVEAMNDDLGVPAALAVVHSTVREGNGALASGDKARVEQALGDVLAMTSVLGINPRQWADQDASELAATVDDLVRVALDQREAARARRDFATSDAIREQLAAAGVVVEDTPSGPRWTVKGR
ncbi:MAG: cysteine--tRNA ligase [Chloroflexi bacterium]|nr:cysteine--tRNA ligase [Chloroflexota bacterium]